MFCERVKEFLSHNNIDFEDRNAASDPAAQAELGKLGYMTTPVPLIEGEVVMGFDRPRLQSLLKR